MIYRRGKTWHYRFKFQGQLIRESTHSTNKNIAQQAERQRRHELERGVNRIPRREPVPLFRLAAEHWLESKTSLTPLGRAYYLQYVRKLTREFGNRLISDISADEIAKLQHERQKQGLSGRQINCEVATLRAILRKYKLWAAIVPDVKMLSENKNAGRALSPKEEIKLLDAIARSTSPALYPFFVLALDAGLRPSETRRLRHRHLKLTWRNGAIVEGVAGVPLSKTEAGERVVPLTRRVCAALTLWLARFPEVGPDAYVFPHHHVGIGGNRRMPWIWDIDLTRPMGQHSYKASFDTARKAAQVECRLYDARHTFVTRLAENPNVSEETIRQLAGHISPRMLARYAHIRMRARRDAIATLDRRVMEAEGSQKWSQAAAEGFAPDEADSEKLLY